MASITLLEAEDLHRDDDRQPLWRYTYKVDGWSFFDVCETLLRYTYADAVVEYHDSSIGWHGSTAYYKINSIGDLHHLIYRPNYEGISVVKFRQFRVEDSFVTLIVDFDLHYIRTCSEEKEVLDELGLWLMKMFVREA